MHFNAILTDNQIKEIRRLWETGEYSQFRLAKKFDVSQSYVSRLVKGKRRSSMPIEQS